MPEKVTYFKSFYYVHWTIEKLSLKSSSYREANVVRKCLHFRIISLYWPKSLYSGRGFSSTDLIYAKIFQPNRLTTHFFLGDKQICKNFVKKITLTVDSLILRYI